MQPKTHVVDGVTFVATPYRAGTLIREDVFWRQFTVTCQGYVGYPEDDPIYGTYWMPSVLELGQRGLIEDAMALALACVSEDEFDLNSDTDSAPRVLPCQFLQSQNLKPPVHLNNGHFYQSLLPALPYWGIEY